MKIYALIPARYNSTRFPGKLMQKLGNETVIYTTYKAAIESKLFDKVYVVTDSTLIYDEITQKGGVALISVEHYECGTDRIAAAATLLPEADIIINIQGDEPFLNVASLTKIIEAFKNDTVGKVAAVSLMHKINNLEDIQNPNNVKVVLNHSNEAALFSRSVIPYHRDLDLKVNYFKHVGIYAFRRNILIKFAALQPGPLELVEKLEGNRFVENKIPLLMIVTDTPSIGIDTEQDLIKANQLIANGD